MKNERAKTQRTEAARRMLIRLEAPRRASGASADFDWDIFKREMIAEEDAALDAKLDSWRAQSGGAR